MSSMFRRWSIRRTAPWSRPSSRPSWRIRRRRSRSRRWTRSSCRTRPWVSSSSRSCARSATTSEARTTSWLEPADNRRSATSASGTRGSRWSILGQSPFGNVGVWYTRLEVVDPFVNAGVGRFAAQAGGLRFPSDYCQTRGTLAIPLLTLHTTLDPDVPFFHERAYAKIVAAARTSKWLAQQSVQRYGHCNVTPAEVATTLSRLVSWAENGGKPASGDVTLDLAISSPDSATTSAVAAASAELTFDEAILSATTGLSLP